MSIPKLELDVASWRIEGAGEQFEAIHGVSVPSVVTASGPADAIPGLSAEERSELRAVEVALKVVFSAAQGQYLLSSLTLTAGHDEEVNGVMLRAVPPLRVLRWVLPRTFSISSDVLTPAVSRYALSRSREEADFPSANVLTDVAMVYRLATIVRDRPAKAVSDTFGFATRTASNWIVRARDKGLLQLTSQGSGSDAEA